MEKLMLEDIKHLPQESEQETAGQKKAERPGLSMNEVLERRAR